MIFRWVLPVPRGSLPHARQSGVLTRRFSKLQKSTLLHLAAFVMLSSISVAGTDWEFRREDDGIRVYTRSVPNSNIRAFKGTVKIKASLDSVMGVLDDVAACTQWVHRCKSGKVVERKSFNDLYTYKVTEMPFPTSDRDIVVHKVISQDPKTKAITIHNTAAPDFIPRTRNVRIEQSDGTYVLQPLPDGYVEVTWEQLSDPGGRIPRRLVNSMIVNTPLYTLNRLRELAKTPKYQEARLRYNSDGVVEGFAVKSW